MPILIFFIALWYLSLFTQTFFQHRYAAHGAFQMSKGWERFFFILTYIMQGSSYLSTRTYAVMHRMHHAYTDTELDPHSPAYSKNAMDMMWKTKTVYTNIYDNKIPVDAKFTKNVPDWPAFDRWAHSWPSRFIFAGLYLAFFIAFSPSLWWYLLLPVILTMGPVHGVIINWFAHKYGYENYKQSNTSQNLFHVDILMLGESYHNNHHQFPSSINFGRRWHEIDPIYGVIRVLGWMKVIKLKKEPKKVFGKHHEEHELVEENVF